jgi:hypothetical protein
MPPDDVRLHPHLFDPRAAASSAFRSPLSVPREFRLMPVRRAQHAADLKRKIEEAAELSDARVEEQKARGIDGGHGIALQFESAPAFEMKFESLDVTRSGIELLSVRSQPSGLIQANVFVPDGKLEYFLRKIAAYGEEQTKPNRKGQTRPKNEDLIANISDIRVAALEALWTDTVSFPGLDEDQTWEVWLRHSDEIDHLARFREHAAAFELRVGEEVIEFIDRKIVLVHGKGRSLSRSNELIGAIAEPRLAKTTADFFTTMTSVEQQAWVDDLAACLRAPPDNSPYVCLLDTGLNHEHPLIRPVAEPSDLHAYKPAWGVDDRGRLGHGTPMAGLAIYGDLADVMSNNGPLPLTHRIESVKLINSADPHEKTLYGAVTIESVNRVEVRPDRRRAYCMAVTATDGRDRGRPSSWSAAIDDLASGRTDGVRRLMLISAGNTADRRHYPDGNMTDGVHDPAQAWNALTIGGYTDKALIDQRKYPGWRALARAGDLAPSSCTSMTWKRTRWPIKPDIVLEAGNMGLHPDHVEPDYIDDRLQLLSTAHDFQTNKPLVTFGDTSAATAIAARLAAMLWAKYPNLTPESVRALIVHSAAWTPAMLARFTDAQGFIDYEGLVRCFGYGVPTIRQLFSSADNSLTLIAQESITPFHKDGTAVKPREMKLHALPWPRDELAQLLDTPVTMRVTLSYFIEPNPGARGWTTKFGYQSHGLRFAVKRAPETTQAFVRRINKAAREDDYDADHFGETGEWIFKNNTSLPSLGSLRSNIWRGKAADLAARDHIAVVPTYGWWNKRPNLEGYIKASHYALIVTITTPETDIYTAVATQIGVPVVIET